jgi:hypothetical protein
MIGDDAARHGITPRQRGIRGHVVETPPNDGEGLVEQVGDVVGGDTTTQITLQRLVDLGGERFEAVSPLRSGTHLKLLSGIVAILSSNPGRFGLGLEAYADFTASGRINASSKAK